ncbi:unnamed protein product [Phaedon cochleariae]|uniref:Uncharacterized protein n=1 Tax=Phaedon cochleariae TaxID=80249 RepID=A0A9N9SDJ0_PHACE|nr:unnamed protein product [Phaedon cochleariae]
MAVGLLGIVPVAVAQTIQAGTNWNETDIIKDVDTAPTESEDEGGDILLNTTMMSVPAVFSIDEVHQSTIHDSELSYLKKAFQTNNWPKELKRFRLIQHEQLCIVDARIFRVARIVLTLSLHTRTLEVAHKGLISYSEMNAELGTEVWWHTIM